MKIQDGAKCGNTSNGGQTNTKKSNGWGQTNTKYILWVGTDKHNYLWHLVNIQSVTDEIQDLQNLPGGWVDGWPIIAGNNTTPWLHLASWNLPDSQFGWESKMEASVAINKIRGGVTKKKEKIWDNVPIRVDPSPPSDIWDIFEFQTFSKMLTRPFYQIGTFLNVRHFL